MATDLGQGKTATGTKHETFVEQQLARTEHRIRLLDVISGALGLLILVLTYGLAAALLDYNLALPSLFRQIAFGVFVLAALGYTTFGIVLPTYYRRINPYFAARQLESTVPQAKNSVINWLDLRDEKLPPAIRGAVGKKAARDLAQASLDRAVSTRRAAWLGGIGGVLFFALVILFVLTPGQFGSLMSRAFAPFLEITLSTQTQLAVVGPKNATVSMKRPVTVTVRVGGKIPAADGPEALKLLFRYPDEPQGRYTKELPFAHDNGPLWKATVPADSVRNGFWYKVTGGDAETPAYQILVKSTPVINDFEVTYSPPSTLPGRVRPPSHDPNLHGVRGTGVTLDVRTNRTIKEGRLDLLVGGEKKTVPGKVLAKDPEVIRFQFPLTWKGEYRVQFTSRAENGLPEEPYPEQRVYRIDVDPVTRTTFKYRPYLGGGEKTFHVADLPALTTLRGTKVALTYLANQPLQDARLDMTFGEGKDAVNKTLAGVVDSKSPDVVRFPPFVHDLVGGHSQGSYGITYTTRDGERSKSQQRFRIQVLRDAPPSPVVLTKPGKDIELPANGILQVEGSASDDFGIKDLTLRLQVLTANSTVPLAPKVYRGGKIPKTGAGQYPTQLAYKDFVELAKVRNRDGGRPFTLEPGMMVEYWLEATDNCDYPESNKNGQVTASKHYSVTIKPPEKNKQKQQEQKKQAQQEQKQHEQKQDQDLANQKDRKQPPDPNPQPKQEKSGDNKDNKENKGQKGDKNQEKGKPDKGEKGRPDPQQQKKADDTAKKLNDAAKNQEKQDPNKDEQKGGEKGKAKLDKSSEKGSTKSGPQEQQRRPKDEKGDTKPEPKESAGQQKGEGKKEQKGQEGKAKGEGKKEKGQEKGDSKRGGKPEDARSRGTTKGDPDASKKGEKQSEQSPGGVKEKPKNQKEAGQPKGGGTAGQKEKSGQTKKEPQPKNGKQPEKGQNKPEGKEGTASQPKATPKAGPKEGEKKDQTAGEKQTDPGAAKQKPKGQAGECECKGGGKNGSKQPKAQSKGGGKPGPRGEQQAQGTAKGEKKPAPKAGTKGAGQPGDEQKGKEKGAGAAKADGPKGREKSAGDGQAEAGNAKQENADNRKNEDGDGGEKKEQRAPTQKEIKDLFNKLKNLDPKERKEALKKLSELGKQAKGAEMSKALKDAQEQLAKDPKALKDAQDLLKKNPKEFKDLLDKVKGQDPKERDKALKELSKLSKQAKDAQTRKTLKELVEKGKQNQKEAKDLQDKVKSQDPKEREKAQKELSKLAQKFGPNWTDVPGRQQPPERRNKPKAGDAANAKKAGNLSISDWLERLKKMSPEERARLLKKAQVSDKDIQSAEQYVEKTQPGGKGKVTDPKRGGGKLPSTGPKEGGKGTSNGVTLNSGGSAPTPGYKKMLEKLNGKDK
jgi:hypothetical protein